MSIRENVSSAIEPEDRGRVKAVAVAVLEREGFIVADELLDKIIAGEASELTYRQSARASGAIELAACIVNYLREDLEPVLDQAQQNLALLQALQREAGQ
jgi:hypothetical protein